MVAIAQPQAAQGDSFARRKPRYAYRRLQGAGRRHYNPELGRWLNRDPIGERGGLNIYGFVRNEPVIAVDAFGLQSKLSNCRPFKKHYHVSAGPGFVATLSVDVEGQRCDCCSEDTGVIRNGYLEGAGTVALALAPGAGASFDFGYVDVPDEVPLLGGRPLHLHLGTVASWTGGGVGVGLSGVWDRCDKLATYGTKCDTVEIRRGLEGIDLGSFGTRIFVSGFVRFAAQYCVTISRAGVTVNVSPRTGYHLELVVELPHKDPYERSIDNNDPIASVNKVIPWPE